MAKSKYTRDLYQEVTDKIIAALESGTAPWVKPWKNAKHANAAGLPYNFAKKNSYRGINTVLLWAAQEARGYELPAWLTFKQAQELGGTVRKGEKGETVIFWKFFDIEDEDTDKKRRVPMARAYTVFNIEQCDGIEPPAPFEDIPEEQRHAQAEAFLAASGATIEHGGNQAVYYSHGDIIHMPYRAQFPELKNYYATALHELTHWTGHGTRLDRNLGNRFGTEAYAAEELIAELGSAFLCARLDIEGELQHPDYIKSWLRVLKDDKRAIFTAARMASDAADYLADLATQEEPAENSAEEAETDQPTPTTAPQEEPTGEPVPAAAMEDGKDDTSAEQPTQEEPEDPKAAALQKAHKLGEQEPHGDIVKLREEAMKGWTGWTTYDFDAVDEAVNEGQYQAIRRIGLSLPVPVRESDIPRSVAERAFTATSFSPERRGRSTIRGYVHEMVIAWQRVEPKIRDDEARQRVIEQFERFHAGYVSRLQGYLQAHSRVMSAMIVGPAKFPTARNRKKGDTADRRLQEAITWYEKGIKRLFKAARGPIDNSPKSELERARNNLKDREERQTRMKRINAAHRAYLKKPESLDKADLSEEEKRAIRNFEPKYSWIPHPFAPYELQNNNAEIRRLKQRIADLEDTTNKAAESGGTNEIPFEGGTIELDYQEGYVRIRHEEKPEKEVRQQLKNEYAFRWSRRNAAWQRKLTPAGIHAAEQATGARVENQPAPEATRTALPPVPPAAAPQLQLPF